MAEEMLRRRYRLAAERLLEDESLRSNLTDEEARVLLDWGLAQVERVARETVEIAEEERAWAILEERLARIRSAMRRVNDLAGQKGPLSRDEIIHCLAEFAPGGTESGGPPATSP